MRQVYAVLIFLVVMCVPAHAQVAAGCVGPVPTGDGQLIVLPETGNVNIFFEYADTDLANIVSATLRLAKTGDATALSTQVVTKAAMTRTGAGNSPGSGCYQLPVVPVSQLPRGIPIQATVSVTGGISELASAPSNPTDPFGRRLPSGVARAKP